MGLLLGSAGEVTSTSGLDFPGNDGVVSTMRFEWDASALSTYNWPGYHGNANDGLTFIWRAYYRDQTANPGYFTCFFYCNDGSWEGKHYGFHPYPVDSNNASVSGGFPWDHHIHSVADGSDYPAGNGAAADPYIVTYNKWYIHVARIIRDGTNQGATYHFYPDWEADNTDFLDSGSIHNVSEVTTPVLVFGDAPHSPGNEVMSGVLRGFQIYDTLLTTGEIASEIATPGSVQTPWYLKINPTPDDITDDSGNGHDPSWENTERPTLWTG